MIRFLDWLANEIKLPSPLELLFSFLGSLIGSIACTLYFGSWASWQGAVIGGAITNIEILIFKWIWRNQRN